MYACPIHSNLINMSYSIYLLFGASPKQVKSYCGHGIGELFHCAPDIPHYASKYHHNFSVNK